MCYKDSDEVMLQIKKISQKSIFTITKGFLEKK